MFERDDVSWTRKLKVCLQINTAGWVFFHYKRRKLLEQGLRRITFPKYSGNWSHPIWLESKGYRREGSMFENMSWVSTLSLSTEETN